MFSFVCRSYNAQKMSYLLLFATIFSSGEQNVHLSFPVESMHFVTFFRDGELEKIRWNAFSGVLLFIAVR